MRSRIIVGALLVFGVLAAGTSATSGDGVAPPRQWAMLTLTQTEANPMIGIARLTEYQFGGDCEAHGIPSKP